MATRKLYHREPRYKDVARNEAADVQETVSRLTLFIADHPTLEPGLRELFQRKVDLLLEYHDLLTEIINYKKQK